MHIKNKMTFWLLHVASAVGVGLLGCGVAYLLTGDVFWGLVFTAGLLGAQFIDLDHYSGSTTQLFNGAKAVSYQEYERIYTSHPIRHLHNHFILYLVTMGGLGLIMGLWLHFGMDGLI